jgi:hypothetical protein
VNADKISCPKSEVAAARDTMTPVAVEKSKAGIWDTSPSPIVRRVYSWAALPHGIPFWKKTIFNVLLTAHHSTPTLVQPTDITLTQCHVYQLLSM